MSEESIGNITTTEKSFAPTSNNFCRFPDVRYNVHCLINGIIFLKK